MWRQDFMRLFRAGVNQVEFVPENEEQPVVIAEPDRIGAEVSDPLISPRGKRIGEDAASAFG